MRVVTCPDMVDYFMKDFCANVKRLLAATDETVKEVERLYLEGGLHVWSNFELSMIVAPVSEAATMIAISQQYMREHANGSRSEA